MTIKVNNSQMLLLKESVLDELRRISTAIDVDEDLVELYQILRSVHKHYQKQHPKIHYHRISKRRAKKIGRRIAYLSQQTRAQEAPKPIETPTRWNNLKRTLTNWIHS